METKYKYNQIPMRYINEVDHKENLTIHFYFIYLFLNFLSSSIVYNIKMRRLIFFII